MPFTQPLTVIAHCGLHKTGSTYLQSNLRRNKELLSSSGILYINTQHLKNELRPLWNYVQSGENNTGEVNVVAEKVRKYIRKCTKKTTKVSTILISFESLFGTLRSGLVNKDRSRPSRNGESESGLYRYAENRMERLITCLSHAINQDGINWKIVTVHRDMERFSQSCYSQLIKEGHDLSQIPQKQFIHNADFSFASQPSLEKAIRTIPSKWNVKHIAISYESCISRDNPEAYLWAFLAHCLKDNSSINYDLIIENFSTIDNSRRKNPSLNERGLTIARQARPLFRRQEWKKFRKFLEKNYSNDN